MTPPNDRDIQAPNWWYDPDGLDFLDEYDEEYDGPDCSLDEDY